MKSTARSRLWGPDLEKDADAALCAILRGEPIEWLTNGDGRLNELLVRRAQQHGVAAIIHDLLSKSNGGRAAAGDQLRDQAIAFALWEVRHQLFLTQVHAELARMNIRPLLFKGTALAYGVYSAPWLRVRGDTDMLIPVFERQRVHEALTRLGFEQQVATSGDFISYQASYVMKDTDLGKHHIDLHWRINNSEVLSNLFSYDELFARAIGLPRLCDQALSVAPIHALLLACVHRQTHLQNPYYVNGVAHFTANRLIWLYDIHLLAALLSPAHWQELVLMAKKKNLCGICLDGIHEARRCFHTICPESVLLELAGARSLSQPALYLSSSKLKQRRMDFLALKGLTSKVKLLKELAFPPVRYMHGKYPKAKLRWLPWLYARRGLGGVGKCFGLHR